MTKVDSRSSLNGWKSLNSFINQVTIRLRQQRKRSLGDAIIAATALIHRLPVVTNNVDDFSTVEGLTIIPLQSILAGTA
ncbi:MAG TPA: PIN domain-containing protein [Fibrella sp.]